MTREARHGIERIRCDICRELISSRNHSITINDTVSRIVLDACSVRCADRYWKRYQLPLSPCSNTGVTFPEGARNE